MRNVFGWSMVLSGCLVGIALSQNPAQPDRTGAQPRPGGAVAPPVRGERPAVPGGERGEAVSSDQKIAACIYLGCRNHIEIAEFAQSKLTNPQARQFAEKMVSDHSPGCEKMRELAGNLVSMRARGAGEGDVPGRAIPGAAPARPGTRTDDRPGAAPTRPGARNDEGGGGGQDQDAADRREERQERREERRDAIRDAANQGVQVEVQPGGRPGVAVRAGGAAGGELDWIQIHQEIADKCLATLKKELGETQGANFDEAYMAHEVMTHLKTIDELSVLKNHASPTLRADIDKSIQMAQGHLREAKQIKSQLREAPDEPRLSRQPEKTKATTPPTTPRTTPRNKDE